MNYCYFGNVLLFYHVCYTVENSIVGFVISPFSAHPEDEYKCFLTTLKGPYINV